MSLVGHKQFFHAQHQISLLFVFFLSAFHCHLYWDVEDAKGREERRLNLKKVVSWDRTIICLPSCYPECSKSGKDIAIPRKKRAALAAHGLIGKIHLESDWTEDDVFAEIRSVFSDAMGDDTQFPFSILIVNSTISLKLVQVDPKGSCWRGPKYNLYPG